MSLTLHDYIFGAAELNYLHDFTYSYPKHMFLGILHGKRKAIPWSCLQVYASIKLFWDRDTFLPSQKYI